MAYNNHIKFAPYRRQTLVPRAVYVKRYSGVPCKKSAAGAFIVGGGER